MDPPFSIPFDTFWQWLSMHPNCIVRAGGLQTVIYDDEDFYWHFAQDLDGTPVIQVVRGKRLIGELFVEPAQITFVQALPPENSDEHIFELIAESDDQQHRVFYFVMAHGWEDETGSASGSVH